jgi:hypothetical protein
MNVQFERRAEAESADPESAEFKLTRLPAGGDSTHNLTRHGCGGFVQNRAQNPRQARAQAQGSDFMHSETQKVTTTLLSSMNMAPK